MTTTPPPPPNRDGSGHHGASSWSPEAGQGVHHFPQHEDTFAGETQQPQWNASSVNADGTPRQTSYPGPSGPGHYAPPHGQPTREHASDTDRLVAIFCHLSGIIAFVLSGGLLPFLGPLVVWLLYKDKDPFVRRSAAGSFNFHVVVGIVYISLVVITVATVFLATPLTVTVAAVATVLYLWWTISAAMKASRGEPYTYPMELKILN